MRQLSSKASVEVNLNRQRSFIIIMVSLLVYPYARSAGMCLDLPLLNLCSCCQAGKNNKIYWGGVREEQDFWAREESYWIFYCTNSPTTHCLTESNLKKSSFKVKLVSPVIGNHIECSRALEPRGVGIFIQIEKWHLKNNCNLQCKRQCLSPFYYFQMWISIKVAKVLHFLDASEISLSRWKILDINGLFGKVDYKI